MNRLLVVEDDPRFRRVVTSMIQGAGLELEIAEDGESALAALARGPRPDAVLLDLGLPDWDGVELVKRLTALHPEVPVVIATVTRSGRLVFDCIKAGARGYLLKKDIGTRVVELLQDAVNGGAPMTPTIARLVIEQVRRQPFPVATAGAPDVDDETSDTPLTKRETEVVGLLAKGLSYDEVGTHLTISLNTVRSHVRAIYEKLHAASKVEAVMEAMKRGLIAPGGA